MKTAYVTALCNGDGYAPGVEALGQSLVESGSRVPRVVMVTADVPTSARSALVAQGWHLRDIEPIPNPKPAAEHFFRRFDGTFTKLRAWELTEFDRVVFLDADTLVVQNADDLFDRPGFAAAPDFFMPDRFNSGVMVLHPSQDTFQRMLQQMADAPSYDGGDQGFLNTFFAGWYAMPSAHRLPAGYNMANFIYQFMLGHPPVAAALKRETKILHYMMQKPWKARSTLSGGSQAWWEMYLDVHPEMTRTWRARLHSLEDRTFDHIAAWVAG
jgi:hypothetical protein